MSFSKSSVKRWSMKELKEVSDRLFIVIILRERQARCTNVYSPLYEYITHLIGQVERQCPDDFTEEAR